MPTLGCEENSIRNLNPFGPHLVDLVSQMPGGGTPLPGHLCHGCKHRRVILVRESQEELPDGA